LNTIVMVDRTLAKSARGTIAARVTSTSNQARQILLGGKYIFLKFDPTTHK
jgi:hypothetical protein